MLSIRQNNGAMFIYDHFQVMNMTSKGYNLPDEVVLDSLESLNETSVKPMVVGGIAVSLHIYPKKEILRKTKDLDLCLSRYLTESKFKNQFLPQL